MKIKLSDGSTRPNYLANGALISSVFIGAGIALLIINSNYQDIGIGCMSAGGLIVLISFMKWRKEQKKISNTILAIPRPISTTLSHVPSIATPALRSATPASRSERPLIFQRRYKSDLPLPIPQTPYPSWLPGTWGESFFASIWDPLARADAVKRFGDNLPRLPYTITRWQSQNLDLAKKYVDLHAKYNTQDFPQPHWTHYSFTKKEIAVDSGFLMNALKKQFGDFFQDKGLPLKGLGCVEGGLETVIPDMVALDHMAVSYRKAHHISLFVISEDEFESRLLHEKNNRDPSAPPYFGFLVVSPIKDKSTTETAIEARPFVFFRNTSEDLECCNFQNTRVYERIFNKLEVSEYYYENYDVVFEAQHTTSLVLLANALIDLQNPSDGRYKSLKVYLNPFLSPLRMYSVRCLHELPTNWIFGNELADPRVTEISLRSAIGSSALEKYRRNLDCFFAINFNDGSDDLSRACQHSLRRAWFKDGTQELLPLPQGIEAAFDPITKNLNVMIRLPFNTYSHELALAFQQEGQREYFEAISQATLFPIRNLIELVLDYKAD